MMSVRPFVRLLQKNKTKTRLNAKDGAWWVTKFARLVHNYFEALFIIFIIYIYRSSILHPRRMAENAKITKQEGNRGRKTSSQCQSI